MEQTIISARIIIGVTGHRELNNLPTLAAAVKTALETIAKSAPPMRNTPLVLNVLSPLAEGADRLVARETLKFPRATLDAVLPLPKDDYQQDFTTETSKKEFEEMLAQAKNIITLPPLTNRDEAYEQAGRYVVDHCDVLVALWNGRPGEGQGGTQEIIQYARDNRCPLVWINSEEPAEVTYEMEGGINTRQYNALDEYNSEKVKPEVLQSCYNRQETAFTEQSEKAGLPADKLKLMTPYFLQHYVHGDIAALKYQHFYHRTGTIVYSSALAAVIVAVTQDLFFHSYPLILLAEILFMLAALGTMWLGHKRRWQAKWLDYRFLAERFRSALFMAMAGLDIATLKPPRHLSLSHSPKDWIVPAFATFWAMRPKLPENSSAPLENVKKFLGEAWLEDQIKYHESTSRRHFRRYQRMLAASYILFGLTIVTGLLIVLNAGTPTVKDTYALTAVVFPAAAACIAAIRTHRDYLRTSMRATEMAHQLTELKDKLLRANKSEDFRGVVREAEETMLHENEDWRVVVRYHEIHVS